MKKTEKIRYEVDPHNRLVSEKTGKESEVPGFRTVLDGEFEIDENNQVTYHVKKSQGSETPQQVKLRGKWALDNEHNLVLTLDKWGNQIAGNKLTVESELIDAKGDEIAFSVTSKDSENNTHIYIVKLGGIWQADEHNRLMFNVQKESDATDKITLRGAWEVNKQNELMYTYEKSASGKKEKVTKAITFRGYWDIAGKHRIIYVLNKEIGSEFDFKVSVGKPAARGLEYEIGVGATPSKKTITLFGGWKVNKNLGLLFEMPYAEGKIQSIVLGGWGKFNKDYRLDLRLQTKAGEDLGIDVKLSRRILKGQGEAFIRALRSQKEVSIVAGIGFRW
jgi:hypothetical protein